MARLEVNDVAARELRPDLRAAAIAFAWLAAAIGLSSLLVFVVLASAPALLPGAPDLVAWNPFASAAEVELAEIDEAGLAALVRALEVEWPDGVVEGHLEDSRPRVVVVAQADKAELVRGVLAVVRAQGHATPGFTMGPNLGRVATRAIADPGAAGSALARLLPLALFCGSGVLLGLGYVLRRRLLRAPQAASARPSDPALGPVRRTAVGVLLGLGLALLITGLSELAARLGAPITEQPWLAESLRAGGTPAIAVVFAVVVLAPLGEEVFFRGYLLPALARALGPTAAVLLSSLAFAGVHGHAPAFPAYLLYGVALALAARRSGSLHVPVAAHVTVNLLAVLLLLFSS